jgi:hypothetical protein
MAITIEKLARKYKLKIKKYGDGDLAIPGTLGEIYMYDENEEMLGAMFRPPRPMKGWANRKRELTELGAVVTQNGDMEGAVMFPASNTKLVRTAMRLLGIKTKTVSNEQRKVLSERLKAARAKR